MGNLKIDIPRLNKMLSTPPAEPGEKRPYRQGEIFFVGGELPVFETLETMFESHCTEAISLFYLTFGHSDDLELVRQL